MTNMVFMDVDTQRDFLEPGGALYIPGAEIIVPRLAALTHWAHEHGVQIVATTDDHTEADGEISAQPDFRTTFPPHCMRGTRGQERIEATAPRNPLYIENRAYARRQLAELLRRHRGEIVIKKQALDVRDAIRAVDEEAGARCEASWRRCGVEMVNTTEIVGPGSVLGEKSGGA